MPRMPLMRAVRVAIHCERTRCNVMIACCASLLTVMPWIPAQRSASRIASQSARSVLLRRRYGVT
jgi:hypothetical protein